MLSEITKELGDYYEHERQSKIDWEKKPLRKQYTIEYCDDEGKLEKLGFLPEYGGLELDQVFHSIHFNEDKGTDAFDGIAIERFLYLLFNPKICSVKLWEDIYEGNELIQERWVEFPSTFPHEMGKFITKSVMEERDRIKNQIIPLQKELESFNEFLKEYNSERLYKEWKEKRECTR